MQEEYNGLSDIQSEVLAYLKEHPNAADTAEGIRQWWLLQRMAKHSQEKVQKALEQLKDAHLLETRLLDSGHEVFRLTSRSSAQASVPPVMKSN
jgi:Fe2+ or Zn2+ uptake regulation protein